MPNENQILPTDPLKQLDQDWNANVTSITQLQNQCNEELAAIKSRTKLTCETATADLKKLQISRDEELTSIKLRSNLAGKNLIASIQKMQKTCLEDLATIKPVARLEVETLMTTLQQLQNQLNDRLVTCLKMSNNADHTLSEKQQLAGERQEQAELNLLRLKNKVNGDLQEIIRSTKKNHSCATISTLHTTNRQHVRLFGYIRDNDPQIIDDVMGELNVVWRNIILEARQSNEDAINNAQQMATAVIDEVEGCRHQARQDHQTAVIAMQQIFRNFDHELATISWQARDCYKAVRSQVRQLEAQSTNDHPNEVVTENRSFHLPLFSHYLTLPPTTNNEVPQQPQVATNSRVLAPASP